MITQRILLLIDFLYSYVDLQKKEEAKKQDVHRDLNVRNELFYELNF